MWNIFDNNLSNIRKHTHMSTLHFSRLNCISVKSRESREKIEKIGKEREKNENSVTLIDCICDWQSCGRFTIANKLAYISNNFTPHMSIEHNKRKCIATNQSLFLTLNYSQTYLTSIHNKWCVLCTYVCMYWKMLQLILAFVNAFQMLAQIMGDETWAYTSETSGYFGLYS